MSAFAPAAADSVTGQYAALLMTASVPDVHQADPDSGLAKIWPIFPVGVDNPISLRAISPKGAPFRLRTRNITFNAAEFPDVEVRKRTFADAAIHLNQQGYNAYIVLNPIKPSFNGNRENGLAVSDADIACRHRLLIDVDRVETLDAPATNSEIEEASEVANRISTYLIDMDGLDPFRVMSGNGVHLYLPLDNIANDPASKENCQRFLIALGRRFNTATIKVDPSVYNASRITKVPGTIARKGMATEDRPYRMAQVL